MNTIASQAVWFGILGLAGLSAQEPQPVPKADYVAHEWGTFTSMVGHDGIALEGLHREEEALPPFVHDLLSIDEFGTTETKVPASRVTQKMETPVVYFHTDRPLRVAVRVWFARGLMTQFYPLPAEVYPQLDEARRDRIDMSKVEGSSLLWNIELLPRGGDAPAEIPAVDADHPWAIARQVSAAFVRTRGEGSPARPEAEHYLFYRGLGRWQPRLQLELAVDGAVLLRNDMDGDVPFVAVLELDGDGGSFVVGEALGAGASQRLSLVGAPRLQDRAMLAARLGDAVHKALVRSGLFQDEARAMVATWSRSWFQKPGARVIYLLPRREIDAVLPMALEPQPKELVRTLVGRLEFVTRAAQARVEGALRDAGSAEAARAAAGEAELKALDRFLEPHLRNVIAHSADAAVRAMAERRLAEAMR